jgi:hypothetical protein
MTWIGPVFSMWKQEMPTKYLFIHLKETMNNMVFRVVAPSGSERAHHFRGTDCLHLQGSRVSQARNSSLLTASAGFLLGILSNPEDGGDMSLQNIGLSLNYMALQHRSLYSS